jgi:hypothetical protein
MRSDPRALTDVSTGRTAVQGDVAGVPVTVITEPHPLGAELRGRAFVLIVPTDVFLDDDAWDAVLPTGGILRCDGGVLLAVRDDDLSVALEGADPEDPLPDLLVPLVVRDMYFPPVCVLVPLSRLRTSSNLVDPYSGPRVAGERERCAHPFSDPPTRTCPFCFWRWWNLRARKAGLIADSSFVGAST